MERSLFELKPPTRWLGRRVDVYREVDSTNRVAEQLALRGAPEGLLVLADSQSAGRGRMGRSFYSPGGCNLYLSLLLRPRMDPRHLPQHVFVAALALAETVAAHLPSSVPIEIKWPNDLLLGERKTSGINLVAQLERGRVGSLVLGIGVNVNIREEEFPAELRPIATSLRAARGEPVDRVALCEALLSRLEAELERFRREGFEGVLEGWTKYFRMQGERVRVGGPGISREIEGVVEGLDSDGALLVRSDRALERILAGDATLVREGA
jgi:BirA family biotin operon repressor/biotin-[acetyl-CoA-carboxylase] ligase